MKTFLAVLCLAIFVGYAVASVLQTIANFNVN